jgi:hypothetical protein
LHRFAGLASDLQQSAMISAVEYRKLRTTLQLCSGAVTLTALQQREDLGI